LASPYQVATEGDQSESDDEYEVKLTSFLGLKQEEGVTNIKSETTKINILENACSSLRAILSKEHLDLVSSYGLLNITS
jgi:hypothetical protein